MFVSRYCFLFMIICFFLSPTVAPPPKPQRPPQELLNRLNPRFSSPPRKRATTFVQSLFGNACSYIIFIHNYLHIFASMD